MEETSFKDSDSKNESKISKPKIKYKYKAFYNESFILYFYNFCSNTSIHGFKFFGEKKRSTFERIYWSVVIVGAMCASAFLIHQTYRKWVTSPVIVTFANTETPIWNIPFPAITICAEVNVDPLYFNFTDVYLKYLNNITTTKEEDKNFKIFSLVCNEDLDFINETETKYISIYDRLQLSVAFADPGFTTCKWMGNNIDCLDSLSIIPTSEGLCNTFNMLKSEEIYVSEDELFEERRSNTKAKLWSLEGGYPPNAGLKVYPRRTVASGVNGGFKIDFDFGVDIVDYLCTNIQGYKVSLHHPAEVPNLDKFFRIPLNQVVVAAIKLRMITTSKKIRAYSPEIRKCYLAGEKNLTMFRGYSQNNCIYECVAKFIEEKCGCKPFYFPGISDKICGAGSKRCIKRAKVEFNQNEVSRKLNGNNNMAGNRAQQCECFPACTSIEFDSETSQTNWDWKREHRLKYKQTEAYYKNKYMTRLIVYYKSLQFMTSERHELYGLLTFLGNCGGLLGLFCGFFITSLMEIIYYLTIRLCSNIYKLRRKI